MAKPTVNRAFPLVAVVSLLLLAASGLVAGCAQPSAPPPAAKAEPAKAPAAPAQPTQAPAAKAEPAKPAAPAQPAAAPKQRYKIKYAWQPASSMAPIHIAKDKGIFQELGLDIEYIRFNSGPAIYAALKSGDVEMADMSSMAYMVGRAQGVEAKVFGVIYDLSPTNVLVVQGDSGIKTAKDLKGKKLAAVQGSSAHFGLVTYLSQNGMTMNDIQFLNMDGAVILPAFLKKDIDAAFHWAPWYNKMVEAGGIAITDNKQIGALGVEILEGRPDWLRNQAEAVKLFIEGQARAVPMIKAERDMVISTLAENAGTTKEIAATMLDVSIYPTPAEMATENSIYSLVKGYEDGSAGLGAILKKTADFQLQQAMVKTATELKGAIDPEPLKAWAAKR